MTALVWRGLQNILACIFASNQAKLRRKVKHTVTLGAQEGLISVQLVARDRNTERNQVDTGGKQ